MRLVCAPLGPPQRASRMLNLSTLIGDDGPIAEGDRALKFKLRSAHRAARRAHLPRLARIPTRICVLARPGCFDPVLLSASRLFLTRAIDIEPRAIVRQITIPNAKTIRIRKAAGIRIEATIIIDDRVCGGLRMPKI